MSYIISEYPQNKYRFRLYDNTRRLTWKQIQEEHGPDCVGVVNLALFALTNIPGNAKAYDHQSAIMIGGAWGLRPKYHEYGILIDEAGHLSVGTEDQAVYDYAIGCPPVDINGRRYTDKDGGRNGWTYTGVKADGTVVVLLCSKDTPETTDALEDAMRARGCIHILRWDGSWSSQGTLGSGLEVTPSQKRICRSWLLIFRRSDDEMPDGDKEDNMDEITVNYMTRSDCYQAGRTITPKGIMVHSTATPGVTAAQLRASWDKPGVSAAVHAIVDDTGAIQTLPWNRRGWHAGAGTSGQSANDTHISFEICEPDQCRLLPVEWVPLYQGNKSNPAWAVERLQRELVARGYDPKGVDGSFGPGCKAAVMAYQKDAGLTVDGSCGPATRAKLAARPGSYLQYRAEETAAYFAAVWERSVILCAKLCEMCHLDPMKDIICHAEGYRNGVASSHADIEHWWPYHGKGMADFRKAVKDSMDGKTDISDLETDVDVLAKSGIIGSPDYWKTGSGYADANVVCLIHAMAEHIRKESN